MLSKLDIAITKTDKLSVAINGLTYCRVTVGSNVYYLRWTDPLTGRRKARSAGTTSKRDAERAAALFEQQLHEGRPVSPSRMTWDDFVWKYGEEVLAALAEKTAQMFATACNALERTTGPRRLADLTAARPSEFVKVLRVEGKTEATIKTYCAHLRAALHWAAGMDLLPVVPKFPKFQRAKGSRMMKGRLITAEEFDRMIEATLEIRRHDAPTWQRFLTGLWLSGLRLEEGLVLSWDRRADFAVDLAGRRPKFRIRAAAEKGHRDRVLPMTPDFALPLDETPGRDRQGRVFRLDGLRSGRPITIKWVSRVISAIGRRADVKVGPVKYASAHDLRRSFGTRWAKRVMPAVLQKLMRHVSIETTMRYYVDLDADDLADELWQRYAGNTTPPAGQ